MYIFSETISKEFKKALFLDKYSLNPVYEKKPALGILKIEVFFLYNKSPSKPGFLKLENFKMCRLQPPEFPSQPWCSYILKLLNLKNTVLNFQFGYIPENKYVIQWGKFCF